VTHQPTGPILPASSIFPLSRLKLGCSIVCSYKVVGLVSQTKYYFSLASVEADVDSAKHLFTLALDMIEGSNGQTSDVIFFLSVDGHFIFRAHFHAHNTYVSLLCPFLLQSFSANYIDNHKQVDQILV
jgi:hypothetical protein